jgi:adenylate cyclase
VDIRIGIATGPALIGNMGSANMKNYTIMGDTVNLAARMDAACKEYDIRFLISDTTYKQVDKQIVARQIDLVTVKGKTEPTLVFEPLRMAGGLDPVLEKQLGVFQQGLEAYRSRDWNRAQEAFRAYLADNTGDGPSHLYLDRIARLRENPPGEDWDDVWPMTTK